MPTDLQALVGAPAWRCMEGMLLANGYRLTVDDLYADPDFRPRNIRPDLTDPATLGCMLALAREAWSDPTLHVVCIGGRWWAVSAQFEGGPGHDTEGEALAAAIIAAPA